MGNIESNQGERAEAQDQKKCSTQVCQNLDHSTSFQTSHHSVMADIRQTQACQRDIEQEDVYYLAGKDKNEDDFKETRLRLGYEGETYYKKFIDNNGRVSVQSQSQGKSKGDNTLILEPEIRATLSILKVKNEISIDCLDVENDTGQNPSCL